MRKLLLAAAAAVLLATPAFAADLPVEAEPVAPAYLPFTWTGFYVGATAGYAWMDTKWTDEDGWYLNDTTDLDNEGFLVGGTLGYNVQFGSFVVGVEGDISAVFGSDERVRYPTGEEVFLESETNWLATLRGRVGVAFDRFLVYGTGGFAFTDSGANWDEASGAQWELDETRVGFAVGGGVEYALTDNWTIKAEALYVDFGDDDADIENNEGGMEDYTMSVDTTGAIARVGVNYKF